MPGTGGSTAYRRPTGPFRPADAGPARGGGAGPFWATLAAAFGIAAGRALDIESDDIECSYRARAQDTADAGELLLYDKIPGGAGHVESIRRTMKLVLDEAAELLAACDNPRLRPVG